MSVSIIAKRPSNISKIIIPILITLEIMILARYMDLIRSASPQSLIMDYSEQERVAVLSHMT